MVSVLNEKYKNLFKKLFQVLQRNMKSASSSFRCSSFTTFNTLSNPAGNTPLSATLLKVFIVKSFCPLCLVGGFLGGSTYQALKAYHSSTSTDAFTLFASKMKMFCIRHRWIGNTIGFDNAISKCQAIFRKTLIVSNYGGNMIWMQEWRPIGLLQSAVI